MARSFLTQRIAWLATALMFVACASAPEPMPTKRKKKRKSDRSALKKKKKKSEQAEKEAKEEQPDKPSKKHSVVITDDDEDEDTAPKKKKSDDDEEEVAAKKRKKEEEAEEAQRKEEEAEKVAAKKRKKDEDAEAAAEKKRKKDEEAERKKDEEAEALAEKKRKKDEEAEEVATKSKKKKGVEAEDAAFEASVEADETPKKKKVVAEAEPAEIDMSGGDSSVIEMEGDEEPPVGERRVAAIAVPGVESEDEQEQIEASEPLTPGVTPRSINNRPLTVGQDKLAVHGGLRVGVLTLPNLAGMDVSTTTQSFALGGTYGVSDKLEVGGDYTLGLSPGSVKGPFTLHGAYTASTSAKLDVAVAAAVAVDFYDTTDPVNMQTTSHTLASFQLGAWARYRLNRKLSVFTGLPALPAAASSVSKLSLALPPISYQMVVGLNDGGAIALDVPVGLGYQATPKLYTFFDLDLAHVRIKNTVNAFVFKDFIPFQLGAFYALSKLDIGAQFSDDLKQGFDYLRFDILLRYSIK